MNDQYVTELICALRHEKVKAVEDDVKEIRRIMETNAEKRSVTAWKVLGAVLLGLALVANIVIGVMK